MWLNCYLENGFWVCGNCGNPIEENEEPNERIKLPDESDDIDK
jgi:hypothetical protein